MPKYRWQTRPPVRGVARPIRAVWYLPISDLKAGLEFHLLLSCYRLSCTIRWSIAAILPSEPSVVVGNHSRAEDKSRVRGGGGMGILPSQSTRVVAVGRARDLRACASDLCGHISVSQVRQEKL